MDYVDAGFWDKTRRYAGTAGKRLVEKALCLFYAARDPKTPAWARSVIYGALAYFISPLDAIPDLVPFAGFADDLGVVAAALVTVAMYVTDDVKALATAKAREWFGA